MPYDDKITFKELMEAHLAPIHERLEENSGLFKETREDMKDVKKILTEVQLQTTKTNGRVNKLDEWSEEAKKVIESNTSTGADFTWFKNAFKWAVGVMCTIIISGASFGKYLVDTYFDKKIGENNKIVQEQIKENNEIVKAQIKDTVQASLAQFNIIVK